MIGSDYADVFEVVNGPEDGAEFPVPRTPVDIGSDPGCGVHISLDPDVKWFHARVTVVSDGYRVRRLTGGPVYVNGKRAGVIRSRIARNGGIVQVGNTELALRCASGGLAGRSVGLPSESDLGWLLRIIFRKTGFAARVIYRGLRALLGRFFWWLVILGGAGTAMWFFRPALFYRLWYQLQYWFDYLQYTVRGWIG